MANIERLLGIMARLRDPDAGCPWDLEQTFATIAPHTIEEAYEVADAIQKSDLDALKDELGDLLFQVVFYARMAEEQGLWRFNDVAGTVADKMVRRHPHIFGDVQISGSAASEARWEDLKAAERAEKAAGRDEPPSVLDDVVIGLPALTRALKLQKRAARVGFDWTDAADILDKIEEEIRELRSEMATGAPRERVEDETGDLLFAMVNLARRLEVDPEAALRGTNAKFERRFRHIETELARQGRRAEDVGLDEMEELWQNAKKLEKSS